MRGWLKVLMWVWILLACAVVGGFVAYRFPEWGIRDVPHSAPRETPSPSPSLEAPERWTLAMTSRTTHAYRVGGSCTSDWRMRVRIQVSPAGRVHGEGTARLLPGAGCDFPSAQVQADAVAIRVGGRDAGDELHLRLRATEVVPAGAQDLGGFVRTLPATRFSIEERGGARLEKRTQVEDPEDEIHVARTILRLSR